MILRYRSQDRGAIMVVVLGLITIMLGLLLGVTVSVYQGIRGAYDYQANVQYIIHWRADATAKDSTCPKCPP